MSDPNANPVIDPNANTGVNDPNANTGVNDPNATSGAAPASTTTSMKMPNMPSVSEMKGDKQSIGEILNKDSVKGMDLTANLDGLTDNMVAIACIHRGAMFDTTPSTLINNMEKSLKAFTAVKLTNVDSNEIDNLNKFPDTTTAKCEVLDSKNNKNVTEISEQDAKNKNAQLFTLIKSAISSDTTINTGTFRSSIRKEIASYNTVLGQLSGGVDLKFAGANACTQVVFGVEYDNSEVKRVVGRIQSVGNSIETGDFSMDLDGDKYVITAGKDAGITVKTILKKILNTKKPIEMKVEEAKPAEGEAEGEAKPAGQTTTSSTGGKSKRRRHKKKGTRKHKPKRTMKKRKSSRRRSSKK
jgi:hypothetical protein